MTTLEAYRDDGSLAAPLLGRAVAGPSIVVVALMLAVSAVGLLATDAASAALAFGAFVVIGLWSAALREDPRLGWLIPPALRVGEYAIILWLAWRGDLVASGAAFGLLAAVAFHHYDTVYRLRHQRLAPPRWLRLLGGGWEVRSLLLVGSALTGTSDVVVPALAIWCGVLFVAESLVSWIAVARNEARDVSQSLEDEEEIF